MTHAKNRINIIVIPLSRNQFPMPLNAGEKISTNKSKFCPKIENSIIKITSELIREFGHINGLDTTKLEQMISDGFEPIFTPFPGYSNLNTRGQVINSSKNDGKSDNLVPKANGYGFEPTNREFKEYTFTVDRLPSFRSYRVKIVMTSNSQVYVPRLRDLRVLALA